MSRRYGRKQKRAARERILDLSCIVRNLQSRLDNERVAHCKARGQVSMLLETMELWDSEIRGLLGPYTSLAFNDRTFRVDHPDQIRQCPIMPTLRLTGLGPADDLAMADSISYHVETLLGFVAGLDENDLNRLRRLITLRIMVGDERRGSAYYAMSESAWNDLKRAGPDAMRRMVQRVAADMMRVIARPAARPTQPTGDDLVPAMERDLQMRNRKDLGR